MSISVWQVIGIGLGCLCMTACGLGPKPDDPRFAPTIPDMAEAPQPSGGSLFNHVQYIALYDDRKAHQVGDIITITLVEKTSAKKEAKTHQNKTTAHSITSPTVFGTSVNFGLPKVPPVLQSRHDLNLNANLAATRQYTGEADSGQSNELTGGITVVVSQILPNKNLVIRGEKWITVNQGAEFIRLTGIVRPEDVAPDNSVSSNRVANARIAYSGRGSLYDTNRPGWLDRFFASGWMPF